MWNSELGQIDGKSSISDTCYDWNTFYKYVLFVFFFPPTAPSLAISGQHQITNLKKSRLGECEKQSKTFEKKSKFPSFSAAAETLLCMFWLSVPVIIAPSSPVALLPHWLAKGLKRGFRGWQEDGAALEEWSLIRKSLDLVPLEWDTGPGDPGWAAAATSSTPSDQTLCLDGVLYRWVLGRMQK